jgi:CubicO group peptidase (beta-lactamase class C family)
LAKKEPANSFNFDISKTHKMSKISESNKAESSTIMANWRTRPFSRWAFRNVKKLIPSMPVENDPRNHSILIKASKSLNGLIFKLLLKITSTDAIVVLHKGEIVYESYANGNDSRIPHILMSATKAVIGLVAGILEHKGAIDLNAPVSTYVPQTQGTVYQDVTLRQLLDMRSGIELDEHQQNLYDLATNWEPVPEGKSQMSLHEFYSQVKGYGELKNDTFRYASANTDLLGWAIESATGRTFNDLLSDLLWKPMGAEHEAYITVDKNGAPRCTGGLCATARDFARIGQLIIDGGIRDSKEITPISLIADIANNGDPDAWKNGQWGKAFAPISKNMSYRSGWYIINEQPQILFAMGIYGQNLFVDRANKIVIAKFSSWKKPTDYLALPLTHYMVKRIRMSLLG